MPKTSSQPSVQSLLSIHKQKVFLGLGVFVLVCVGVIVRSLFPYWFWMSELTSVATPMLKFFEMNTNKHGDAVGARCWYDAGDYVIFAQRDALATYYLALATKEAKDTLIKRDAGVVTAAELSCLRELLATNTKQIRDQASHGVQLPPFLHGFFYPQTVHRFQKGEGKDVTILTRLSSELLGISDESPRDELRDERVAKTVSANCCEEGPLALFDQEMEALKVLAGEQTTMAPDGMWGLQLPVLAAVKAEEWGRVKSLLEATRTKWKPTGEPFDYIGGSYDIAGTIVLTRWYERATGDVTFRALGDELYQYLHGKNSYGVSFAGYDKPYHPCTFFKACSVGDVLVNGIDERLAWDINRHDAWRLTEVQTVGQAQYVLMEIVYRGL